MTDEQEWINNVVASFYELAKTDDLIGYHFQIIKDFESHIPRIAAFWEIQLLGSTQREVSPGFDVLKAHLPLGIKRGELGRWIVLFKKNLEWQVATHPEFLPLKEKWLERVTFFEGNFSRFFRF